MRGLRHLTWLLAIAVAVLAGRSSGPFSHAYTSPSGTPQLASARACGHERRAVKTLTDRAAGRVDLTSIPSTVEALRALPVPGMIEFGTPRLPQEMHTYTVTARLLWDKLEADSDFHIVIAGQSGVTMIAEFPDPACTTGSLARDKIAAARAAFITRFGLPDRQVFRRAQGQPTLQMTGVSFFDVLHGQRGAAPNGVELHPVMDLR